MMSGDMLRRAAEMLREHAEKAQNQRPWCPDYTWSAVRHVQRNCDFIGCGKHGVDKDGECWSFDMYDGRYVALMHPPVALALADWLDYEARDAELDLGSLAGRDLAFAVARAILREES